MFMSSGRTGKSVSDFRLSLPMKYMGKTEHPG